MELNEKQYEQLCKPLPRSRVGKDGKGFSHVEVWDIRRVMNGIFGFCNWSASTDTMELVFETEITPGRWNVAYRAQVSIYVARATYVEWAIGDVINYPSRADAHDMAVKTAESQAFKRAAVNLGDQFGLGLYNDGGFEKDGTPKQSVKATLDRWATQSDDEVKP